MVSSLTFKTLQCPLKPYRSIHNKKMYGGSTQWHLYCNYCVDSFFMCVCHMVIKDLLTYLLRYSYKASCVRDRVKLSFVIFDIWTLWRWGLSIRVPRCQKLCVIGAWLHLNLLWMSLVNFKPKRIASASCGFLAAAQLSCYFSSVLTVQVYNKYNANAFITQCHTVYMICSLVCRSHRLFRAFFIPFVSRHYVSYVNYNILVSTSTSKLFRI